MYFYKHLMWFCKAQTLHKMGHLSDFRIAHLIFLYSRKSFLLPCWWIAQVLYQTMWLSCVMRYSVTCEGRVTTKGSKRDGPKQKEVKPEKEKQIQRKPRPKAGYEKQKERRERTTGLRCCFGEVVLSLWWVTFLGIVPEAVSQVNIIRDKNKVIGDGGAQLHQQSFDC